MAVQRRHIEGGRRKFDVRVFDVRGFDVRRLKVSPKVHAKSTEYTSGAPAKQNKKSCEECWF
jgi:hypothetical protein